MLDGVLLGVIPEAGPGGANALINPINGLLITTDVFGHPRTNALGFQDIGAVQAAPAPAVFWLGLAALIAFRLGAGSADKAAG